MRIFLGLVLLLGVLGCEATDDEENTYTETAEGMDHAEVSCDCSVVMERATPTYTCAATAGDQSVYLCEDGDAGLDCVEGTTTTWSNDGLSCESVFCVTTDDSECQVDCSCTDVRS